MNSLQMPYLVFSEFYVLCSSGAEATLKTYYAGKFKLIQKYAYLYEEKMVLLNSFELAPIIGHLLLPLRSVDLNALYKVHMVGKNSPGRPDYDKIIAGAKKGLCCYCSWEEPTEIDHFFPASKFPEFSVLPINLIPTCHRCNRYKFTHVPKQKNDSFIHPYFENYDNYTWLKADLEYVSGVPVVKFYISDDQIKGIEGLAARLKFQFAKLQLRERYSNQVARELSTRRTLFQKLSEFGKDELKKFLANEVETFGKYNTNCWQAAAYRCFLEDAEFSQMNWKL